MNKKQLITILQSALFYFEGATEQEILNYNCYNPELIKAGIKLVDYLNSINQIGVENG